jgi:hypothetical protein
MCKRHSADVGVDASTLFNSGHDRGEVVAMIGDLPLSQAGIPGQARANRFVRVSSDIKSNEGLFVDDPATGSFSVTCRHLGTEKNQWYSRSRFSRDSIDQLLSSFPNRKASLVQVTGGPKVARSNNDWNVAATFGGWWQGAGKAEALLASPGWIVRVENTSGGSVLRSLPVLVPSILLCVIAIAFVSRMFSSSSSEAQPQEDTISPQPCCIQECETSQVCEGEAFPSSNSAQVAPEAHEDSLEAKPEHSTEADELAVAADSPAPPDLLQSALPCSAIAVPDSAEPTKATAATEEWPEVAKSLPEEVELPDELFTPLTASSEVSVAAELEHEEFTTESELALDSSDLTLEEAAIIYADTEIIVGEPMPIELEFPRDSFSPDSSPDPYLEHYYSAVILGPSASAKKDRHTCQEALGKAQDEDFPETIELSWTEPTQDPSVRGGASPEPHDDDEKSAKEKKSAEGSSWGQYSS